MKKDKKQKWGDIDYQRYTDLKPGDKVAFRHEDADYEGVIHRFDIEKKFFGIKPGTKSREPAVVWVKIKCDQLPYGKGLPSNHTIALHGVKLIEQ